MGRTHELRRDRSLRRPAPLREAAAGAPGPGGGLLGLQRSAGNTAVQRAVSGLAAVPLTNPLLLSDERIVAAAAGNTMHPGAPKRSVAVLQQGLDAVGFSPPNSQRPDGSFDGAWGGGTAGVVGAFQDAHGIEHRPTDAGPKTLHALDDELNKGGGGGGGGGGEITPVDPPVFTEELEDVFDRISLEYGSMLAQQGSALTAVQADLKTTEGTDQSIGETVLLFAANTVLDKTLGSGDTLRKVVGDAVKGISSDGTVQDGFDKAVGATFDGALTGGKDVVKQNLSPGTMATQPLATFIDAQHNALIGSANKAQAAFLASKKDLRTAAPGDGAALASTGIDPRVARAEKLLAGLQESTRQAHDKEYLAAMRSWNVGNVQQGTDDGFQPGAAPLTDLNGLVGKGKGEVPGVLEVEVGIETEAGRRTTPVTVTKAAITGMSPAARTRVQKLAGAGATIGSLGYVVRVSGSRGTLLGGPFSGIGTRVQVAKNEAGQRQSTGSNDNGAAWLADHGSGDAFAGIDRVLAEAGSATLDAIGGIQKA